MYGFIAKIFGIDGLLFKLIFIFSMTIIELNYYLNDSASYKRADSVIRIRFHLFTFRNP